MSNTPVDEELRDLIANVEFDPKISEVFPTTLKKLGMEYVADALVQPITELIRESHKGTEDIRNKLLSMKFAFQSKSSGEKFIVNGFPSEDTVNELMGLTGTRESHKGTEANYVHVHEACLVCGECKYECVHKVQGVTTSTSHIAPGHKMEGTGEGETLDKGFDPDQELSKELFDEIYGMTEALGDTRRDSREERDHITDLIIQDREQYATKYATEALDSLYWMYIQYCSTDGHLFMGAGEIASDILEKADYIRVDNVGRVTTDYGDSATKEKL